MTLRPFVMVLLIVSCIAWARLSFALEPAPHIRTADSILAASVVDANIRSESFRRLLDDIAHSDLIVYVEFMSLPSLLTGRLNFVGATVQTRFVRVQINRRAGLSTLQEAIAHELFHAGEIARAQVRSQAGLEHLYRTIGFRVDGFWERRFESHAAQDAALRVRRELAAAGTRGRRDAH